MDPLFWAAMTCIVLWLLFPKGFEYLVGGWVGAITGAFFWGLFGLGWFVALGLDMSWGAMAWSFLGFVVAGICGGLALAARS